MCLANNKDLQNVIDVIHNNNSFLVISHISPDGDTIGSAAAFCYALHKIGKKCKHIFDGTISHNMSKFDALTKFVGDECECDVVVAMDCADLSRLGKYAEYFERANKTMVIDHHKTNNGFGKVNYVRNFPACAQCVFQVIDALNVEIDSEIAQCLYIAFLTDTGRFSHNDVTKATMEYVSRLYEFNVKISDINREMYEVKTFFKTKLLAKSLDNLQLWFDGDVAVIFLNYDEYELFATQGCDNEGIVNYALNVEGCKIAVFAYEKLPNVTKVSFRSVSPEYDVAQIASNFGGGGHMQAAGCTINEKCDTVRDMIFSYFNNKK